MTVRKRFVAEITLTVSAGWLAPDVLRLVWTALLLPTDTLANTYIPGTLKNAGTVERTLFTGPRITGPITPNFGNIVILNPEQDEVKVCMTLGPVMVLAADGWWSVGVMKLQRILTGT